MNQCGLIFLSSDKNFVINCMYCKTILTDFNKFQIHILENHLNSIVIHEHKNINVIKDTENDIPKNLIKNIYENEINSGEVRCENHEIIKSLPSLYFDKINGTSIKKEESNESKALEEESKVTEMVGTELKFGECNVKVDNHIKVEVNVNNKSSPCSKCDKKFTEKLQKREKRKKCDACPVCSLIFSNIYDHIRSQHIEYYNEKVKILEFLPIKKSIKNSKIEGNYGKQVLETDENEKVLGINQIIKIVEKCDEEVMKNDNRKIKCKYCGELFLTEYFPTHQSQRRCGKCPVCLSIVSDLFRHVPKFHKEYVEEKRLLKERVIQRMPLKDENKFLCTSQAENENLEIDYNINIQNLNENSKNVGKQEQNETNKVKNLLFCMYCEKTFKSKGFFNNHVKLHETKSDTCKYCGKRFKYSSRLKKHLRLHTGERPYQCEICSMSFNESTNLKAHFINRHTEGMHLKCTHENCEKVFKTKARRRYHELYAHSNKYKNLCKECGLIFRTSGSLNEHYKRKHIKYEDRDFSCSYCDRKFAFKFELIPHEMLHLGKKRYQCDLCLKGFIARKSFKRHCKEIHGKEINEITKKEKI